MKILLFTTSILSDKSSSWLLLREMINDIDSRHEIIIFSSNYLCKTQKRIQNLEIIHTPLMFHTPIIRKVINKIWKKLNYYIDVYYSILLSNKLKRVIKQKSIDKIWTLNNELTVLSMNRLLEQISIPYHISIFDDLFLSKDFNLYGKKLKENFVRLLSNSTSLDVVVPEQRDYYVEKGIINSTHLTGISYGGRFKNSINENMEIRKNLKKICLTGTIFGIETFLVFCSAIEDVCMNENIQIDIYTNLSGLLTKLLKRRLARYTNFVTIKPFIPVKEIITTIAKYDLAFIQISFDAIDKHKAITSFPSKTHNYLASTVPILLHSPDYASVSKFLKSHSLCYSINTIKQNEIENYFREILNQKTRRLIHENIKQFNNSPNTNINYESLIKLLDS